MGREVASFLGLENPEDYGNASIAKAQENAEFIGNSLPNPGTLSFQGDISEESNSEYYSPKVLTSADISAKRSNLRRAELNARKMAEKRPYIELDDNRSS